MPHRLARVTATKDQIRRSKNVKEGRVSIGTKGRATVLPHF